MKFDWSVGPWKGFSVNGNVALLDNKNPQADIDLTGHNRNYSFAVNYTPGERFSLNLDNLHTAEPNGSEETYRFGGAYYPKAQADEDFLDVADILGAGLAAAGYPTRFDRFTAAGQGLDRMSVYDWIESRVPGGHGSPLGQVLDVAYAIEFAADTRAQAALNLIYMLGYQANGSELSMFGVSDEKFHVRGGNQRLPEAIAADLGADAVQPGHRLVRLKQTANGRYELTFERGGQAIAVVADYVVLASLISRAPQSSSSTVAAPTTRTPASRRACENSACPCVLNQLTGSSQLTSRWIILPIWVITTREGFFPVMKTVTI